MIRWPQALVLTMQVFRKASVMNERTQDRVSCLKGYENRAELRVFDADAVLNFGDGAVGVAYDRHIEASRLDLSTVLATFG